MRPVLPRLSLLDDAAFAPMTDGDALGLLLLSTDATTEGEFARLLPDSPARHVSRVRYDNPTTPDNLRRTAAYLREAAALLPASRYEAIYYACTAASAVLGSAAIAQAIRETAAPTVRIVDPLGALHAACRALEVTRLALLTPYLPETCTPLLDWLARAGLEVTGLTAWGLADDRAMARVRPEIIVEEAVRAMTPNAEALFVSCTALRVAGVIERIERRIERPVLTSNQAAAWLCARLCADRRAPANAGRLFTLDHRASPARPAA